jgi:cation diffusion facilitator CzcD-associated flavoprotein CzcO
VYPHIQFSQHVSHCAWNKETNLWQVTTKEGKEISANILISGSGALHVPYIPEIKGREEFQGKTMHTARWDKEWDPAGKRIAVIGTGASGVQLIPELAAADMEKLYVFQRSPCWSPKKGDFVYPGWLKTVFKYVPLAMTVHRTFYFLIGEFLFHAIIPTDRFYSKVISKKAHNEVKRHIKEVVEDPAIAAKLTPSYEMGCKRVTPSDQYLPSFNKPNVELITEPIQEFMKDGIKTNSNSYEIDTVIYATGFDLLSSGYAYELINKDGISLKEEYGATPQGYLGICNPSYPNFFWLLGPGTGLATNTIIYSIECQADYAVDCIKKMVAYGVRSVTVKTEVNERSSTRMMAGTIGNFGLLTL